MNVMLSLDPSPWLLIVSPMWGLLVYLTYRGMVRNEFREKGRWGWFEYKPGSFDWILSTFGNLLFLAALGFLTYQAAFHGSKFFSRKATSSNGATLHCDDAAKEMTADTCSTQ